MSRYVAQWMLLLVCFAWDGGDCRGPSETDTATAVMDQSCAADACEFAVSGGISWPSPRRSFEFSVWRGRGRCRLRAFMASGGEGPTLRSIPVTRCPSYPCMRACPGNALGKAQSSCFLPPHLRRRGTEFIRAYGLPR
ncbi:hypothetical protein LZ30DRAFT_237546 [Colletotrichum cereale]|nr:hypothetical protein LZ30DRAFT_237546 [Colletotrichum cereale]